MEIDEEYIEKVRSLIEQKDADNVKAVLADLHPADIAELCNDLDVEDARFVSLVMGWKALSSSVRSFVHFIVFLIVYIFLDNFFTHIT